jgi:hypothetical protein
MDTTIWAAIIGVGGTIVGAVIPLLASRRWRVRNEAYDKVTGSITDPKPEQTVGRTFQCSGIVTGLQPGLSLWLAVEAGTHVWPRESKIVLDKDNKWSVTVFEDGASETFSVALYVADAAVDKRISKWLETGRCTGAYPELKGISGARRLARVDDLRLKKGTP